MHEFYILNENKEYNLYILILLKSKVIFWFIVLLLGSACTRYNWEVWVQISLLTFGFIEIRLIIFN